jgi:pyridoxal phosphate enzyme (YggS family)
MSISSRIHTLLERIRPYPNDREVRLMAVTKYATVEQTQAVVDSGLFLLGENKVQDGLAKIQNVSGLGIEWHLIGHLQSNKVKKAVGGFSCIQSIDSYSLLQKIGQEAAVLGKTQSVLLEVNIGNEPNKYGFSKDVLLETHEQLWAVDGVKIEGIMIIPPLGENPEQSRPYFQEAKKLYDHLKSVYSSINTLSMGMSNDFDIALQEGSTLVRVGHFLFH